MALNCKNSDRTTASSDQLKQVTLRVFVRLDQQTCQLSAYREQMMYCCSAQAHCHQQRASICDVTGTPETWHGAALA